MASKLKNSNSKLKTNRTNQKTQKEEPIVLENRTEQNNGYIRTMYKTQFKASLDHPNMFF